MIGPNSLPRARRAMALHGKQADQDRNRDRHDPVLEGGCGHRYAFDRGEYRDCRGDDRVAVEQRRAENAEHRNRPGEARAGARQARGECEQRQDAAFTAVVEAQDDGHVFQRHDQRDRPEHHRQHRQHVRLGERQAVITAECFLERVQRAGADVAVDDAERGEGKNGQRGFAGRTAGPGGARNHRIPCHATRGSRLYAHLCCDAMQPQGRCRALLRHSGPFSSEREMAAPVRCAAAPAAGAALLAPMLESARGSNNRIEATLSVPAGNENGSGAWFKPGH